MAKYYLDQDGTRILVRYIDDNLAQKANKTDLANLATKDELQNVTVDLTGYATESYVNQQIASIPEVEQYDDSELRDLIDNIEAKTSGLYHFKGSVADLQALTAIPNPEVGDTYNLLDTGMNAAWTGQEWDQFGSIADLSEYVKTEDVQAITRAELNAILYNGKSAAVNDAEGFAAMVSNNQAEVEITLNNDVVLDSSLQIPAGKTVTLNLNNNQLDTSNKSLDIAGEVVLTGGEIEGTAKPVIVRSGGTLTIDGTDITSTSNCAVSADGVGAEVIVEDGDITAQEVPILVTNSASVTVNGGHLKGLDNFAIGGNGTAGKGDINVTINGGVIEGNIQSGGYTAAAIYWPNSGTLTINGGTIVSTGAGIVMRGGTVNLNSGTIVTANGPAGFVGKVGDSRVVVGSYAVVYDKNSKYPAMDTMELNIAEDVVLTGTDGDIQIIMPDGETVDQANINDLRN